VKSLNSPRGKFAKIWKFRVQEFNGRKIKIMKRKKHTRTLRGELEELNDYLDLTEARVRDEGKPRLTHDEVKKRYAVK
jgi:hypothetical protein